MPDSYPLSHGYRVLISHAVKHAAVLNIRIRSDADRVHVASNDGIHPDTGLLAQHHISNHLSRFVYVTGIGNGGANSLVEADHVVSLSHGPANPRVSGHSRSPFS